MSLASEDRMDTDDRLAPHDDAAERSASEDESEPAAPADLMVVSRARRSNAGNRMSTLLASAEQEGEWGDEWEEAANEEEFVGDDANDQDDFNMESSSSEDEDEGGDDDEGEKELRRVERQERVKKRKVATNPFAARLGAAARKRVKLNVPSKDSETPPAPAPRPKKKSERASWIPTAEDGPIRTSSRKQTMANKEHTMTKLKEKDRRREDTLAMMKAAEKRKEKDKPKPMTQQERLVEAARVERRNSKSLHRWEEAEEQRAAERQAKLDAMKNRQIDGPFIRYYSGPAIWIDDKLKYTGKDAPTLGELDDKLNKDVPATSDTLAPNNDVGSSAPPIQEHGPSSSAHPSLPPSQEQEGAAPEPPGMPYPSSIMFAPPQTSDSFLFGIEQYAAMQQDVTSQNAMTNGHPTASPQTNGYPHSQATQPSPNPFSQPSVAQPLQTPIPPSSTPQFPQNPLAQSSLDDPVLSQHPLSTPALVGQAQEKVATVRQRKIIRKALRNLLILSSFPNLDAYVPHRRSTTSASTLARDKDRSALIQLCSSLFGWDPVDATAYVHAMMTPKTRYSRERESGLPKIAKEKCAVSNALARYRDPETGIAYRDARAYGVIKGVVGGGVKWVGELGCFVGGTPNTDKNKMRTLVAAKPAAGVPKRFLEGSRSSIPPPKQAPTNSTNTTETGLEAGKANDPITITDAQEKAVQKDSAIAVPIKLEKIETPAATI